MSKGLVIDTSCCGSSVSRSASFVGAPIKNLPAGMRVSFMPMAFVIILSLSCAEDLLPSTAAKRLPTVKANRQSKNRPDITHPPRLDQPPRPVHDHKRRCEPGDDRASQCPAPVAVKD